MRARIVRRGVLCSGAALWLIGATVPLASSQTSAARTAEVTVDFRAVKNGVPVVDLKPQDVVLRVDNVEQQLLALDLIRSDAAGAMAAPFATNVGAVRHRDLIAIVDEESFPAGGEARLRDALGALLRHLTPRDRVGLVSLHASGPSVELTNGLPALQAAVSQVRGRAIGRESAADVACRTRRILPGLTSLLQGIEGGVTATVLLFSAALAAPGAGGIAPGADSGCLLIARDFDEFRSAATRSGAQLYAIHLGDASTAAQDPRTGAGLERLAGEANGQFLRMEGDPAPLMARIASDTAGFYVASIALEPGTRVPARRAAVDLRIRRDGVTARVRPQLVVPVIETRTVSPRDMMRVATAYRALPLRAAGFPSRNPGGDAAKVVVLFEPTERSVSLKSAMAGLFNAKGQLVAQWTSEPQDFAELPASAGLVAPPGVYRLRVAAVDTNGRSGAVDEELTVELPAAGSATTSGILVGVMSSSGFSPRLQFTPADRAAGVYLEVYGVPSCAALSAILEVAPSAQAPPLVKSTASSTTVEQSDACIVFGEVDLGALPPADYAVRLQLQLNGNVIGQRLRTLRKSGG